jgi:hypothetical protein
VQAEAEGEAAAAAGAELGLLLKDAAAGWADAARGGEVHAQVRLLAGPRTPSAGGVLRQAAPHAQAKASTEARAKALQADGPGVPGVVTPVVFSTANRFCVGLLCGRADSFTAEHGGCPARAVAERDGQLDELYAALAVGFGRIIWRISLQKSRHRTT